MGRGRIEEGDIEMGGGERERPVSVRAPAFSKQNRVSKPVPLQCRHALEGRDGHVYWGIKRNGISCVESSPSAESLDFSSPA